MAYLFSYRTAVFAIAASAILHLLAPLFGGFSGLPLFLFVAGLAYAILAFGLSRFWRLVAWLAFIVLLGGFNIALAYSFNGNSVPAILFAAIAIADGIALLALFGILWRSKPFVA